MTAIRDNAKHNKEGRPESHAALRHLYPEMCCIGGLAFYFFGLYHILGKSPPNFAPDFNDPTAGELGRRDWWHHLVFPGNKGPESQMSYDAQRTRTNAIYALNNIHVSSVTHGGRHYVPKVAGDNRASLEGRKALGKWREGRGAFENAYDHQHPLDGMLGVAMFDAQRPDSYTCSRNCLQPPSSLQTSLFPWIEEEQRALIQRREQFGKRAEDYSLDQFLSLLAYLRSVILQDAALIYAEHPHSYIFEYAPFDSMVFRSWAQTSKATVEAAETEAREAFKNIPLNLVSSLRGILTTERIETERRHQALRQELMSILPLVKPEAQPKARSRKRKHGPALDELPGPSLSSSQSHTSTVPSSPLSLPSITPTVLPSPLLTPTNLSLSLSTPVSAMPVIQQSAASTAMVFAALNPGVVTLPEPLSSDALDLEQQQARDELLLRYGALKFAKHEPWDWNQERKEYVPSYQYQKPSTLQEYWDELTVGLNGYMSVQELNNRWEARWRWNISGLKTEKCRYDRVEELISKLKSRDNWTMDLVWRFLKDRFPIPTKEVSYLRTTRSFITYIQKKDGSGMTEVLSAANTYP